MLSASCHFMATPGDAGRDLGGLCYLILHRALWGAEEERAQPHFCPGHICNGSLLFVSFCVCLNSFIGLELGSRL